MTIQEVAWRLDGLTAAGLDKWRRTRRLCWVVGTTMGGFKGTEEDLWRIEGDAKKAVTADKREAWRKRLVELGKIKE